jgi:hypothetical protein
MKIRYIARGHAPLITKKKEQQISAIVPIKHMVLEESLLFYQERDADTFIKFLRERNCRALKSIESTAYEETVMNGTVGNMIQIIENAKIWQNEVPPDNPVKEEPQSMEPGKISLPLTERADFTVTYAKMLSNLQFSRDFIAGIMEQFNVGEVIFTPDHFNRFKEGLNMGLGDITDNELDGVMTQTMRIYDCICILEDNAVVETRSEGSVLLKKIDPSDLTIDRRAWGPDEIDEETLKKFAIFLTHNIHYDTATRVTIDPRIHFNCALEDVENILVDLEVDDDSAEKLLGDLYLKTPAIDRVLKLIETSGKISLPDLIREMESAAVETAGTDIRIVLNSSPEFISSMINDLRKIGIVEGNDRKIRVVR